MYSQFGTNIYASDVVQQALKCIADEIKKLNPTHVRYIGNDPVPVRGSVQKVLDNPNPIMTTSEFLEKITYLLLMNYNVFILPVYSNEASGRVYEALYPIKPSEVTFIEDAGGRLFITFMFWNGYKTTVPYDDIIHIRYNYAVNEYMGGNELGQPDHAALLETLNLNKLLLDGMAKAMRSSYKINGVVKYNQLLDDGSTEAALKELERKLANSEDGFLPLDLKAEFTPLDRKIQLVDNDTLKFIDTKILRHFGVPIEILDGSFDKEVYESFYQRTLEPIVKSMSQAFTKKLFTDGERAHGNKIELYPKELIFMTVSQTLEMINVLAPQGGGYINEYRTWLGLRPLPELEGKRFMSLNWIDADKANEYQTGKAGNEQVEVIDETKEDI